MTRPRKSKTSRKTAEPAPVQQHSELMPEERKARLGTKHHCFSCGARFYDLNKPEPICPKCGEDQRKKPKQSDSAPTPPPAPKKSRPLQLLDDDDDSVSYDEDVDMDVGPIEGSGEELFDDDASETPDEDPDEP